MKILILGSGGMLGTALIGEFPDATGFDKDELDITDPGAVREGVKDYDFVINAAAFTDVDGAESQKELANLINGTACGYLADACRENGARLIHFSTDYVFNGSAEDGYEEDDKPNPLNAYGESKLLGERLIQEKLPGRHYIIRTSWLFGPNGKNFVGTMLRLSRERSQLKVVNDQIGCPTYTDDLAEAVHKLIMGNYEPGLYHITNSEPVTWYDFAREILLNFPIKPIPTTDFPTPAKRPKCSILISTKFPKLRSHREALAEYLKNRI